MAVFHDEEQNKKLSEIHTRQEEAAVKASANDYGIGYVDLSGVGINTDALLLIPEQVSHDVGIACFAMVGKKISMATRAPTDAKTVEQIDNLETAGYTIQLFLVSQKSLEKAWARYNDVRDTQGSRSGLLDISDDELQRLATTVHSNEDIRTDFNAMLQSRETHKVSKLMEIIFGTAIGTKSSDVHIEAGEKEARLRFRQDGVLQDIVEFPLDTYHSINARVKLLSEMKLTDSSTAQDGRFTIIYKKQEIEVRTSLIPGPYGESIVMRILNPEGLAKEFENLGMQKKMREILEVEIEKPNGMILTTGPTGSGKTTTLYSILKKVYTPEIKILTIEDPVEYHLPGITQTQIDHDKGYDFASGLRAALRQDPDVIMVGEIRDPETASTAVNASLTGHIVLSTLHTNNAAGAIPRLIELGVNPKILPDALTVAMAQRMVRKLCEHCKEEYHDAEDEKLLRAIVKNAENNGKDFSEISLTSETQFTMYKAVGCEQCGHIGYKGQTGLFEAILVDDNIADIITKNPSERDIKRGALKQGILTMVEDGTQKILSGRTTIDEVRGTVDMIEDLPEGWHVQTTSISTEAKNISSAQQTSNDLQFVNVPVEFEPNATTESILPMKELVTLIDYLKNLEGDQIKNPEIGIKQKIADLKETIINLLMRTDISKWLTADPSVMVHDEVSKIVSDLEALEQHQSRRPNVGVATQLRDIRNTIENLVAKE